MTQLALGIVNPVSQWFGDDGLPLANGLVKTYAAGTTTPLLTYKDDLLTVPNSLTITLDADGKAVIYLQPLAYKIDVQTAAGVSISGYPRDGVAGLTWPVPTVPISVANGGTGQTAIPSNGQLLIGNGTGFTLAALTAGVGLGLTNGSGAITITPSVTLLDKSTTEQTLTNSVAETALYTFSVPGGTIGTDKSLRFLLSFDLVDNAGGGNGVLIKAKFGGVVIAQFPMAAAAGGSPNPCWGSIWGVLTANGATNSQRSMAQNGFAPSPTTDGLSSAATMLLANHSALAVDSTVAQTFTITATLTLMSPGLTLKAWARILELVG